MTQLRAQNKHKPLYRHALFRAIDLSLIHIQHNVKQEDLTALEEWYATLPAEEMELEELDDEKHLAIAPRVDWTIAQISYHFKAMKEIRRRSELLKARNAKQAKSIPKTRSAQP